MTPGDTDDAFLREVDEGVRADQFAAMWRRWGKWIVAAVVLFLASFGGYLWWQGEQQRRGGVAGEEFSQALAKLEVGDVPAAAPVLDRLAKDGPKGYRPLAVMMQAANAVTAGDTAKAAALYDSIANDSTQSEALRNAALVKSVRLRFDELPPATVIARLKPLAVPGDPWFAMAGEMTALAHLKAGETAPATVLLTAIVRDPASPQSLRARAAQLAVALGVAPESLSPSSPAARPAK